MKRLEQLESGWSYDNAIERVKPMVANWAKKTLEVARELYVAHKELSNQGYRSDLIKITSAKSGNNLELCDPLTSGQMDRSYDIRSVSDFCSAVGIAMTTAKRWLALYDPDKDYLLTTEEYKDARTKELDDFYESVRKNREKIAGFIPEPKDINLKWNRNIVAWTEAVEGRFQMWLVEKGYKDLDDSKLIAPPNPLMDEYGQYGLFGFDYLDSLAKKCTQCVSPEDFYRLTTEYGGRLPKGVDSRDILRIPVIVKAEFDDLDEFQRKETARVLSEIILKLGLEDKE